jgi:hypothetical protein
VACRAGLDLPARRSRAGIEDRQVGPRTAQDEVVVRLLDGVEDLTDEPDADRSPAARDVDRVAEMQPGLREHGSRSDGFTGSGEPLPGDQLVADPAGITVIADERDRGEPRTLAVTPPRATDRPVPGCAAMVAVSPAALTAGSSSSTHRTGQPAIELVHDPQE